MHRGPIARKSVGGSARAHSESGQDYARVQFGGEGEDIGREILSYLISLETGEKYNPTGVEFDDWKVYKSRKPIGVLCDGNPQACQQENPNYASLPSHAPACRPIFATACSVHMARLLKTERRWMHVVCTVNTDGEIERILLQRIDGKYGMPIRTNDELLDFVGRLAPGYSHTTSRDEGTRLAWTFVASEWKIESFCQENGDYMCVEALTLLRLRSKALCKEINSDDCDIGGGVMRVKNGTESYALDNSIIRVFTNVSRGTKAQEGVVRSLYTSLWPMDKVQTAECGNKKLAAVVLRSQMDPVHIGHVAALRQAAKRLERADYCVIGAWLSPVSEGNVVVDVQLSPQFRLSLAQRIVSDDKLASVGKWEIERTDTRDDPAAACGSLREALRPLNVTNVTVFSVCSPEVAERDSWVSKHNQSGVETESWGVVVVPRAVSAVSEDHSRLVFVSDPVDAKAAACTSQSVLDALREGDTQRVHDMLQSAAGLLLAPTESEREQFSFDYERIAKHRKSAVEHPEPATSLSIDHKGPSSRKKKKRK
jgi:hypothetical protein